MCIKYKIQRDNYWYDEFIFQASSYINIYLFNIPYFSNLIVKFFGLLTISSIFWITRFNYFTSSLGLGNSLNLTVLMNAYLNRYAKWCAASNSIIESPKAIILVIIASFIVSYVSRNACIFHCETSVGKYDSYLLRADIMVIWDNNGNTVGINFSALNSTQPSAAFVMIKVFPVLIESYSILISYIKN